MPRDHQYVILEGTWKIRGYTIQYSSPQDKPTSLIPQKVSFDNVKIKQNGRFFSYDGNDGRLPKLGVLEPIFINGKLAGWRGHMVDTRFDNDNFIFSFSEIDECNKVQSFEITYTESGFDRINPEQVPRVEHATATRVED